MKNRPSFPLTRPITAVILFISLFLACTKELSEERGGFSGNAQGELVDSLGNCKNITINGAYRVDTPLNSNNYILVNVNFTSAGKYKIYTDTVNGMWFVDSGFAISTGQTVVKVKGKGTPILPKKSTFTVRFNNFICSFSLTPTGTAGTGGGGGGTGGGGGNNDDYFPNTAGSFWTYQYLPGTNNVNNDTFNITATPNPVIVPGDTLPYYKFGTSYTDTFYFAKDLRGTYYAYSTVDFDYTFVFDSVPKFYITYPFLKENAAVAETWDTPEYGPVYIGSTKGTSKATFTVISKNAVYTIGNKVYSNVIRIKREIKFKPDNSSTFQTVIAGSSYYAKGFGLIDQVFEVTPVQSVSIYRTPTIK